MTDKDNKVIESFFKQAAQQQIEDNGFTERVMASIDSSQLAIDNSQLYVKLWTVFCVVVSIVLFFVLGGWESLKVSALVAMQGILTSLSVFVTTAPTTEVPLNPWALLLAVAFVLVFLPYQTYRKLSATL